MAVKQNPDGTKTVVHEGMTLGRHKNLVRASDFLGALQDAFDLKVRQVQHKHPRVLIESFRVIGTDILTAQDAAFYELLLANAKAVGIDRPQFSIPLRPVKEFLKVRHDERVLASLERLTRTVVRYDIRDEEFRRRGSVPLIIAEVTEALSTSTATLTYTIPDAVRRTILACSEYALVDLAPMAEFRGRYTPRLYQRLCIRAGYDDRFVEPWKISVEDLADQLGYAEPEKVHRFMTKVIGPAIEEINKHAKRFTVIMDEPLREDGRGRRIKELSFLVQKKSPRDDEMQRRDVSHEEVSAIRRPDHFHAPTELPSVRAVTTAAEKTGIFPVVLSNGWRALLDTAKAAPAEIVWGSMTGAALLDEVEYGVDEAFKAWVHFLPSEEFVPRNRLHTLDDGYVRPEQTYLQKLWVKALTAAAEAREMLDAEPGTYTDDDLSAWLHPYGPMFAAVRECLGDESFEGIWSGLIKASKLKGNDLRSTLRHFVDAVARTDQQRVIALANRQGGGQQTTKKLSRSERLAGRH